MRDDGGWGVESSGGSRKKYLGACPLVMWEATTARRNYYRTNEKFGGLGKIWGLCPLAPT